MKINCKNIYYRWYYVTTQKTETSLDVNSVLIP